MGTILIVAGRDRCSYHPLAEPTTVIGRDESCDIQIIDEMISRRHTQIARRDEQNVQRFFITDLKSANGVFVNGRQVSDEIELNDVITATNVTIDGGADDDDIFLNGVITSANVTILGSAGEDEIELNHTVTASSVLIDGGADDDTIAIDLVALTGSLTGDVTVLGGGGADGQG